MSNSVLVGLFPSAGNVHVYAAVDNGDFDRAGLDVNLELVKSSDQQMDGWDSGRYDVMHTSPDHLIGAHRERDPRIVLGGGIGDLTVYHRPGAELATARWGVDGQKSAYALVLRAIVEDIGGHPLPEEEVLPVGGTRERLAALLEGRIDGTTLSPPFSQAAEREGMVRLGSHREVSADYLSTVVVAEGAEASSDWLRSYVDVVSRVARELLEGTTERIADVLVERGWEREVAERAAEGMRMPSGLPAVRVPGVRNLEAVAALRRRFFPDWSPSTSLESLVVEPGSADA